MNIKQKFESTKKKIAEHKTELIAIGVSIGAIATGVYAINKTLKEGGQEVLLISASESDDYDNVVILATKEAREKINGSSSFNLNHVDRDLYSLSVNPED